MNSSGTPSSGGREATHTREWIPDDLGGTFDERFRPVVAAFAATVSEPDAGGAALSIRHRGTEVVNVWRGTADARDGRAWDARTPAVLFSSTKGLASLVVAWLAEQGRIDLERSVASYWPEFGVHGKDSLTVGDLMAHRAGLIAPDTDTELEEVLNGRAFAERLARQRPRWTPGEAHLYHGITWGPLVREVVLRATGSDLPDLFREVFGSAPPADVTLRATDEELSRVAHISTSAAYEALNAKLAELVSDDESMRFLTAGGAFPLGFVTEDGGFNDPRVLKSGLVSAAGIGTASALARIWSSVVTPTNGLRPLAELGIALLTRERSSGPGVTDADGPGPFHRWGAGVQLSSPALPLLTEESFGHDGAGGQAGFADPRHRIGFGYLTNRMEPASSVPRVVDALRSVLDD
ncbi:serine hydrolase domain-containing protein [Nocardiopsis sp. CNS-639]|uniref:serine hydrolase domain-containing protein n=1 Tax=Nocardiopsis sp. CNS-639 TaxID=1169153 RepID=UPI00037A2BAC|nr:serine hydrolase domain-containing protein [Nocardiopsis sp. CNS-639]